MCNIGEKVAYLKGLAEGLKVDESTNEGKIIKGILDVLTDLNDYICDIDDDLGVMQEAVDEISDDLSDVEGEVFGECDGDCCDDDDDEECGCEDDIYEIECPNCGELVYADGDTIVSDEVFCPKCQEKLEIEIPDECGCGCDCHHDEK